MKTLFLIRHAKSSWEHAGISDFDRPLNERGKNDAPAMARRLLDKKISIDAFISSPAKRAKKTATLFAKEYGVDKEAIILEPGLYEAATVIFYEIITQVNNKFDRIAVFAHNPGITEFANQLTSTRIDNIPTCGIFAVKIEADSWGHFQDAKKEFWFFETPKEHL